MENEIMVNEEKTGKGLKIAAGIGLVALVGIVAYKVGKKVVATIKAKKAAVECVEYEENCEITSTEEI